MNQEPEVLQVTEPPANPNATGNATDTPETPEAAPETPETLEVDPQQAEMESLAAEADQLSESEIQPPPGQEQAQEEQSQQPQYTNEQLLTYLVNTVHEIKDQMGNQQQPPQEQQESSVADIYNGAFTETPAADPNNPVAQQISTVQQQLDQLTGIVNGLHAAQTSIQSSLNAQAEANAETEEIRSIQSEYDISDQDAKRVLLFMKQGQYAKGIKYAQGMSRVESASNSMREQRAADRELAGRPVVPGGTMNPPSASDELMDAKIKEYSELSDDSPMKDELSMWIIENGGMDKLRAQATELIRSGMISARPVTA